MFVCFFKELSLEDKLRNCLCFAFKNLSAGNCGRFVVFVILQGSHFLSLYISCCFLVCKSKESACEILHVLHGV